MPTPNLSSPCYTAGEMCIRDSYLMPPYIINDDEIAHLGRAVGTALAQSV